MKNFIYICFIIFLTSIFGLKADEFESPKNEIYKEIFLRHIEKINNLEKENKPLLILFSGPPGIGKSTIAKILEKKLSAIRISSDETRALFQEMGVDSTQTAKENDCSYLEDYLLYFFKALDNTSKNHLFILDRSCDRNYKTMKHLSEIYNYHLFVIRLKLPYEEVKKRIIQRENNPEKYLKFLDKWYADYQKFDETKCDYFIDASVKVEDLPIDDLINQISKKASL